MLVIVIYFQLLGCPEENLKFALTNRSIFAESKKVKQIEMIQDFCR